jgi:hypothetical protein
MVLNCLPKLVSLKPLRIRGGMISAPYLIGIILQEIAAGIGFCGGLRRHDVKIE